MENICCVVWIITCVMAGLFIVYELVARIVKDVKKVSARKLNKRKNEISMRLDDMEEKIDKIYRVVRTLHSIMDKIRATDLKNVENKIDKIIEPDDAFIQRIKTEEVDKIIAKCDEWIARLEKGEKVEIGMNKNAPETENHTEEKPAE